MVLQGAKPAEAHKALTVFVMVFVAGEAYRRASERELLNGAIVLDNVKISCLPIGGSGSLPNL